jgi:L-lactate dehydrogenase complex protein LldG
MATATTAKENILKKIRKALANPVPLPFPNSEGTTSVYKPAQDDDAIIFAEEFTKLQGKFVYCVNEKELLAQLANLIQQEGFTKIYCKEPAFQSMLQQLSIEPFDDLASCEVSVTGCEYLVARTGSVVLSSAQQHGRTSSVYAPIHICIAYNSQLVFDVKDALVFLKEKYSENFPSFVTFATGPSRTADIEKTLVTGVHGPKEAYCFLVENI